MSKNYYEILSVDRKATKSEIMDRFRQLARERHPDRFEGEGKLRAEKEFLEFTEAFNVLRDEHQRAQHDRELDQAAAQKNPAKVYLNRGIRAYKQGNFIQAADNFDRATKADSSNAQAWHHLALTCYQEVRWLPKAEQTIQIALELSPDHAPYVKLAARIFLKSGKMSRASENYSKLLAIGGSDAVVRKALEDGGYLARTNEQFDVLLAWDPEAISPDLYADLVEALGNLARAHGGLGVERTRDQPAFVSMQVGAVA